MDGFGGDDFDDAVGEMAVSAPVSPPIQSFASFPLRIRFFRFFLLTFYFLFSQPTQSAFESLPTPSSPMTAEPEAEEAETAAPAKKVAQITGEKSGWMKMLVGTQIVTSHGLNQLHRITLNS